MATSVDGSCPGGAFVTFVQRDEYAHLAWCLAGQLQRVRSACPLAVMYDARSLSLAATATLERRFAPQHLFELTSLFSLLPSNASFRGQKRA